MAGKWRARLDAVAVLSAEAVVFVVLWRARDALGSVPFENFSNWLQTTSATEALTALARLLGLAITGWLLVSTLVYAGATLSGRRGLLRVSRSLTLPQVRRVLDALAGATIAASSVTVMAGMASATPVSHTPVVATSHRPAGSGGVQASPAGRRVLDASLTPVTRHLPHPGTVHHELPGGTGAPAPAPAAAPSAANGFSGLPAGTKVIIVQPGDCLSVLAEQHLGDWRLDKEIEALNFGRLQADGRSLQNDHWIYPGWVLVMPPNAVGTITVGEGQLHAERTTPKPERTTPKPEKTTPEPAPIPTQAVPRSGGTAPTGVSTTSAPAAVGAARKAEGAQQTRSPRPVGLGASPGPAPARAPEAKPGQETGEHRARTTSRSEDDATTIGVVGLAAVVATGLLWKMVRARREQGHSRRKGQILASAPPAVQAAERRARAVANGDALRWVDGAVRYLSGLVELRALDGADVLPSLVAVRVGRRGLEVVLSPAVHERIGWFEPLGGGGGMRLAPELTLEELEALAEDHWSAWPALVGLGDQDGMALLVNLEHFGSLSVEGPRERVAGVLCHLALQLTTQPWSDEMLSAVYVTGAAPLREGPVLRRTADSACMDLAEKLDGIATSHQELCGKLSISTLRAVASEALPHIVLGFPGSHGEAMRCVAEASVPGTSGVALVCSGPCPAARWKLVIDADGNGSLQGEGDDDTEMGTFRTDYAAKEVVLLSEALDTAQESVDEPEAGGPVGGEEVLNMVDVRGPQPGAVEICLMGPVELVGGELTAVEASRRTAALALICYVATRERLVTADELLSALWPLDARKENLGGPQRKTVMNVISRARAILGYGEGGKERLVYSQRGYRLTPDVTSDWSRFVKLVSDARRQPPAEAVVTLRRALELVRGEPFNGVMSSQFFEWVASEHLDFTIAAKVVDAAQELGELALGADDFETVMWAVDKGLQLEPTREELFRLWMHAFGRSGRPARVDDVYRRLKLVLRQRIHPLQEPQAESRDVWRKYTAVEFATNVWD